MALYTEKPHMTNTQNECVKTEDGRVVWLSRSCAVMVIVVAVVNDKPYVLINKRGPATPDFQGHWNCPCGYIDWNEDSGSAAVRETWEECGLNIRRFMECNTVKFNALKQPWYVNSDPVSSNRQNITLRHAVVVDCTSLPELTTMFNEVEGEVEEAVWAPLEHIVPRNTDYRFAFHHDEVLKEFVEGYLA